MITDNDPIISKFISIPREMSSFNCGAFMAGVVESILDSSGFVSFTNKFAKVSAHSTGNAEQPNKTTILMRFDKEVISREKTV